VARIKDKILPLAKEGIVADEVAELQLFVQIVNAGNLSAAARALNSSPAAMSRRLSALESRLGVRLVTRTSRSFELTEEGQLFYDRCTRIVTDIAEAEAEASSKGAAVKGMLRIGAPMLKFISYCPMPVWM